MFDYSTVNLHDISNLLYRVKVKGITRTFKDRRFSHIKNVFCGFRINTKNIALHKYLFFSQLISMTEEVKNNMHEEET